MNENGERMGDNNSSGATKDHWNRGVGFALIQNVTLRIGNERVDLESIRDVVREMCDQDNSVSDNR